MEITPPVGIPLEGYYSRRESDGILDPLFASAVAFSDGSSLAVLLSVDVIGIGSEFAWKLRTGIARQIGTVPEAVFLCCTHTHTGPVITGCTPLDGSELVAPYQAFLMKKLAEAAQCAVADLSGGEGYIAQNTVSGVSFVRCFWMKDGTLLTNPGYQNPDIDRPAFEADETVQLVLFKRPGKEEIAIVNFQVHPDVVGGCKISADYPKFLRDTFEETIPNSRCIFINGAQGDTNHIDVSLGENELRTGYERCKFMGRAIARAALQVYPAAVSVSTGELRFIHRDVEFALNHGTQEEIEKYGEMYRVFCAGELTPERRAGFGFEPYALYRIFRIMSIRGLGSTKALPLTALSIGDIALSCIPGEPFGDIGRGIRERSPFAMTLVSCCANGYDEYFPMELAYQGGYEAAAARYQKGVGEKMMEECLTLLDELKQ